jgi:lysozyme family protein
MSQQLFFGTAMNWLVGVEGGYVDDPRGGPTYCGIRQGYFNAWLLAHGGQLMNVRDLEQHQELIEGYYLTEYWLPSRIYDLLPSQGPALVVFDGAVNCGINTMIQLFQEVVGTVADGHFGPVTLTRYRQAIQDSGVQRVVALLIGRRRQYYLSLNDPANEAGWANRMAELEARCQTL